MHKTELINGYLMSHLVILLLIFDNLQAPLSLKHLTSIILQSNLFCMNGCLFKATRKPRIFIAKLLLPYYRRSIFDLDRCLHLFELTWHPVHSSLLFLSTFSKSMVCLLIKLYRVASLLLSFFPFKLPKPFKHLQSLTMASMQQLKQLP
jgi:hypothetical protein